MSDVNAHIIQPLKKFAKDSTHLVKKCTKPDRKGKPPPPQLLPFLPISFSFFFTPRSSHLYPNFSCLNTEFARIAYATSVGFLIMGFIGFFVKLIHIPINNILLGGI